MKGGEARNMEYGTGTRVTLVSLAEELLDSVLIKFEVRVECVEDVHQVHEVAKVAGDEVVQELLRHLGEHGVRISGCLLLPRRIISPPASLVLQRLVRIRQL